MDENGNDITDEENNIVEDKIIMMENKTTNTTIVDVNTTKENRIEANGN